MLKIAAIAVIRTSCTSTSECQGVTVHLVIELIEGVMLDDILHDHQAVVVKVIHCQFQIVLCQPS